MHRFTDIESTARRLPPVYGYLTHPLVSLQKALEPISSQVDQLDRFRKVATNECHFPSEHGLTRDESAAVFLYTMEWGENSFYQVINRALRAEDRSTLKPWFAYLKLFDTAIQKLPTVRKNLWRGVPKNISQNFKEGNEFTWWTINSCSTSVNIIKDFLGTNSTLFLIEAANGKDVSGYTNYPKENEAILCPGTRLCVISDPLDQPPMHLVHLKEVTDDTEQELATSFSGMAMVSSAVEIHTDEWGNRYEGEMKDGKRHGKGKMDFSNGTSYTGMWVNDVMTGQGICIYDNGDRYEGQWKDNKMHGQGICIYANSDRYEGQWKQRAWERKMDFASGDKYTVDLVDDVITGQGIYIYSNGNRYEGQWKDNKMHGQGICIYANSDRYEGQWKDNKEHGKGKMDFASGDKYTGDWVDGIRTGQGIYNFANGDRYEGQWKDNKEHGKGKMDFASGDKYTGDWVDGIRTGQGIYNFANGDRYEGQWKDNKMHGKGKMDFASGDKYTGDYLNDIRTGQGIYNFPNGDRYEWRYSYITRQPVLNL